MEGLGKDLQKRRRELKMLQYFVNRDRKQACSSSGIGSVIGTSICLFLLVNFYFLWTLILLSGASTIYHENGSAVSSIL